MSGDVKQYVVLSCDANPDYLFPLPLTCLMWQRLTNWEPRVIVVGDAADWRTAPARCATDVLMEMGITKAYSPAPPGRPRSLWAQMARLYACRLFEDEADDALRLMTADADMWPLSRDFFDRRNDGYDVQLLGAGAYDHETPIKWPLSYVAGTLGVWRELMGRGGDERIEEAMARDMGRELPADADAMTCWLFDELFLARRLRAMDQFAERAQPVFRDGGAQGGRFWIGGPGSAVFGRCDRGDWRWPVPQRRRAHGVAGGAIDAHLDRPGWTERNWGRYLRVLTDLLPAEDVARAVEYHAAFVEAMEKGEGKRNDCRRDAEAAENDRTD